MVQCLYSETLYDNATFMAFNYGNATFIAGNL
jgi:hypothetical protein